MAKGESVGKLEGIMGQAAVIGAAAMSPGVNALIPIKSNLLFGLKGGPSDALPVLYDSVHFNDKDETITVDSLVDLSKKGKSDSLVDPSKKEKIAALEREVGALQGLLDTGVQLWLEDQGYEVTKTKNADGNTAFEATRTLTDKSGTQVEKIDKKKFEQLLTDKKNGFQPFLNGQYKKQAKVFKEELKKKPPQQPPAQLEPPKPK